MPTETDIIDQLESYGAWLGAQQNLVLGSDVAQDPPGRSNTHADTELESIIAGERERRPLMRWLTAAAVVTVVCAGILALGGSRPGAPANQPPAASGRLYVLPAEGTTVHSPSVYDDIVPRSAGLVVGTPDGAGFRDPIIITVTDQAPDRPGWTWGDLGWATGPAIIDDPETGTVRVDEQRDDLWLFAVGSSGQAEAVSAALDRVVISSDGSLSFDGDATLTRIASYTTAHSERARSTYFELDAGIVVETATVTEPLTLAAAGNHLTPITVNGIDGWHLSHDRNPEGTWHGIIWSQAPGAIVAVSGTTDYQLLLGAARSLHVVDEQTWLQRVGPLTN